MSEEKDKETTELEPRRKPEHGAESQLHCYNATSWRLDQWFESDEPEPDPPKPKK